MVGKSSQIFGIWVSAAGQQLWAWNWSQPQVVPPVPVSTFSPASPGRPSHFSVEFPGMWKKKGVRLLKGLERGAFSLETSQRLRVNYQERPGTAKFVLFTLMPQLNHPLTSHFLHLQNRVVNAWSCGLHKFRVYDPSHRA